MTLTELEAIARAATPGPWKAIGGKCLAGVVAPDCQIYLHDARPDMFFSLPRWQATAAHIAAFDPPTVLKLLALWRVAIDAELALSCGLMHTLDKFKGAETDDVRGIREIRNELRAALAAMKEPK